MWIESCWPIRTATKVACEPGETLIVLDEIQEAENGLTVLKYFQENAPEQHIVAAGSLLGIELHKKESFPVGKVDFMTLHPLNFLEFLKAVGDKELCGLLSGRDWQLVNTFAHKFAERLRRIILWAACPEAGAGIQRRSRLGRSARHSERNTEELRP